MTDISTLSMATPEFSRLVRVETLAPGETVLDVTAAPDERQALAERLGLLALDALSATLRLRPEPDGSYLVRASLRAEVVQSCVVTLVAVPAVVDAEFERRFAAGDNLHDTAEEEVLGPEDPPDPLIDGAIDVGEAVAEQLALELDPFPRAPNVSFDGYSTDPDGAGEPDRPNPFAALEKLKRQD